MKKYIFLTPALLLFICQPVQAKDSPEKTEKKADKQNKISYLIKKHKKMKPKKITDYLKKAKIARSLTFKEFYDFGIAWAVQHEWDNAKTAFHNAASKTNDPQKKAACLFAYACLTHLFGSKSNDAGYFANKANQYVPNNIDIAAIRLAVWSKSGDELEAEIALDRMKQIDMNMEGIEVLEPGTIILVGLGTAAIVTILVGLIKGDICNDDPDKCVGWIAKIASTVMEGVMYFENGASQTISGF